MKWFSISKFYTLNIFILSCLFFVPYLWVEYLYAMSCLDGINVPAALLGLEGNTFFFIIYLCLLCVFFVVEFVLRITKKLKTYNKLMLPKILRVLLILISLCLFFTLPCLLYLTHNLVNYYMDGF